MILKTTYTQHRKDFEVGFLLCGACVFVWCACVSVNVEYENERGHI